MPTRRTPRRKQVLRPQITQEWGETFKAICGFAPTRLACIDSKACFSPRDDQHCSACIAHMKKCSALKLHFRVPAWQEIPDDYAAPENLSEHETSVWWQQALGDALNEAEADWRERFDQ